MENPGNYVTAKQVLGRYNITDMTLWRWLADDALAFPRPMVINRRRYFLDSDLVAWERARARKQHDGL
ncbi:DNA-binding protein [Mesorhizobium sp. M1428]|uniref:helix-turn-helix transcriptional regulator n=1 Tax=Mesorhizobium sp. M1428 TaxID=2957102 RepID=UPI0033381C35